MSFNKLSCIIAVAVVFSNAKADDPPMLFTKDAAYTVGQSRVIESRGNVTWVQFDTASKVLYYTLAWGRNSGTETAALLLGKKPSDTSRSASLFRWDIGGQRSTELWRFDPTMNEVWAVLSVPKSNTLIIYNYSTNLDEDRGVGVIFSSTPDPRQSPVIPDLFKAEPNCYVYIHPSEPLIGLATRKQGQNSTVTVVDAQFRPLQTIRTDSFAPRYPVLTCTGWTPDGRHLQFIARDPNGKLLTLRYDSTTKELAPDTEEQPKIPEDPIQATVHVADSNSTGVIIASGPAESSETITLASPCEAAELSTELRYVAYTSDGILFIREVVTLDKVAAKNALAARQMKKALLVAKQCALGFIMYANDNDDILPSSSTDWRESIMPYVKSREAVDQFVYTFEGGDVNKIAEPASTEIGYVNAPGGRCIAYADGHAKFVPDK